MDIIKKEKGKIVLLSLALISAEIISILIGSYRVFGEMYFDWKAEKIADKTLEEGHFAVLEHDFIAVPDLTGRDFNEVAREFDELGGWLRKEGYDYSDEYPKNTIISQGVKPGKKILNCSILYVTVSLGPKTDFIQGNDNNSEDSQTDKLVEIPNLKGLTVEEASTLLRQKGLTVGEILYGYSVYSDTLLDKVMAQSVSAGEYIQEGTSVDIFICVGGLEDYSKQNQVQNNEVVDDTQLCQLVSDYYYERYGIRPPCVRVDNYDGDIVIIHLYEAMSDHDVTWDWYYVDRNTGETTNFMGESFNLFQ